MTDSRANRTETLILLLVLLAVALSRFLFLEADPAVWMDCNYLMDEGLWADGARGKVFFDDYFADDVGSPYLVTPAYTWFLQGIYTMSGVGLGQTRFLAALANVLIVVLCALFARAWAGSRAAIAVALLLGLSPFFWAHGRVALQESTQALFIVLSILLWFSRERSRGGAFASGVAMAVAVAVKPNSLTLGAAPLVAAAVVPLLVARMAGGLAPCRDYAAHFIPRALAASAGFILPLGALFLFHIVPNWARYWPVFWGEAGSGKVSLKDYLLEIGMSFTTIDLTAGVEGRQRWRLPGLSPAIFTIAVLYFMDLILRLRRSGRDYVNSLPIWEIGVMAWFIICWIMLESNYFKPERRYVNLVPILVLLGSVYAARLLRGEPQGPQETPAPGWWNRLASLLLWATILFPVLVLVQPFAIGVLYNFGRQFDLAFIKSVKIGHAGLALLTFWMLCAIALSFFAKPGAQLGGFITRKAGPALVLIFLLYEMAVLGRYYINPEFTMRDRQQELRSAVSEGGTVLGSGAAQMFLPSRVRTVRLIPADSFSNPPPNPDVWDRLQPRYLLQMVWYEYLPNPARFEEYIEQGYNKILEVEVGAYKDGQPRARWELYDRGPVSR